MHLQSYTMIHNIHVFVTQLEFLKKQWKDFDIIRNDYRDATEYYTLTDKNRIKATEDGSFRSLGSIITQIESLMISMNEEKDNKIKKWTQPLQNLLVLVQKELIDIYYKTAEEKVMSADSNPDQVFAYLQNLQQF